MAVSMKVSQSPTNTVDTFIKLSPMTAAIVQKARDARVQRLKQAGVEAEKEVAALKQQLQQEFEQEQSKGNKGQKDVNYGADLKKKQETEIKDIDSAFEKNKKKVSDLLLWEVTTVTLEVSEALRQSLIMKQEQGLNV